MHVVTFDTHRDLELVRKEMEATRADLRRELAETRADLICWVVTVGVLQTTVIIAAARGGASGLADYRCPPYPLAGRCYREQRTKFSGTMREHPLDRRAALGRGA